MNKRPASVMISRMDNEQYVISGTECETFVGILCLSLVDKSVWASMGQTGKVITSQRALTVGENY